MNNKVEKIKEILKRDKKDILLSSIVTLLPILIGVLFWNQLPEQMATHWGGNGEANGWSSKAVAVFSMPVMLLLVHWLCILCTFLDNKNQKQNAKALKLVYWMMPVTSVLVNGATYTAAFGKTMNVILIVSVLMGLTFVAIGNYLPKCRHNYTLGIKIKWTLENEENWNATHRFAGKVWVVGGVLLMASVFLPESYAVTILLGAILVIAIIPVCYSYWYYKKQCKEGTAILTPVNLPYKRLYKVMFVVIFAFVCVILFTGKIEYEAGESSLNIKASYWTDMSIKYERITNLEYRETDDVGSRTGGFGSAKLLMGAFQNQEFGSYTRYSYAKCDACIVVEMGNSILVLSGENEEETKALYEKLDSLIK